jgi:hypothetical protein
VDRYAPKKRLQLAFIAGLAAWLGFAQLFLASIALGKANECVQDLLTRALVSTSSSRTAEQSAIARRIKSTPRATPATIDLTDEGARLPVKPELEVYGSTIDGYDLPANLDAYDQAVLDLHTGDTVVFGNYQYKLGEFLGAGNATHVFALADHPKLAIRIPFHTVYLRRTLITRQFLIDRFITAEPKRPWWSFAKQVKIEIPKDGRGFVLVTRIWGTEDAENFLKALLTKFGDSRSLDDLWNIPYDDLLATARERGDKLALEKLTKLRKLGKKATGTIGNIRQYVWDEKKRDWILADWE